MTKRRDIGSSLFVLSNLFLNIAFTSNSFAGEEEINKATKILRQLLPQNTSTAAGRGYQDADKIVGDYNVKNFTAKIYLGLPVTKDNLEKAIDDVQYRTNESISNILPSDTPEFKIYSDLERSPHIQVWYRRGAWGVEGTRNRGFINSMVMLDLKNFQMVELTPEDRIKVFGDLPSSFDDFYKQRTAARNKKLLEIGYFEQFRTDRGTIGTRPNPRYKTLPEHASIPELQRSWWYPSDVQVE